MYVHNIHVIKRHICNNFKTINFSFTTLLVNLMIYFISSKNYITEY